MARARDELFEVLAEVCGYDWRDMTRSSRGRLNSALVELREVEAQPKDVRMAAQVYRTLYQGASLTPQALTANWPDLMRHVRASQLPPYDPAESHRAALEKAGEELPELPPGPDVPMPDEVRQQIGHVTEKFGNLE